MGVDAASHTLSTVSLTDAPIGERKGVNLPGMDVDLPFVTPKDEADIETAVEQGADFLMASFVQSGAAVEAVRAAAARSVARCTAAASASADSACPRSFFVPRIIAKIESQAGIAAFDGILAVCDGVMVARGDLGVQIAPERVVLAQRMLVAKCGVAGVPVI